MYVNKSCDGAFDDERVMTGSDMILESVWRSIFIIYLFVCLFVGMLAR